MKYLKVLKNAGLLSVVLLLNSISFAAHSSAMPTMAHEMNGLEHSVKDSIPCASQCRTAVFNQEEIAVSQSNEDDDEPSVPFYAQKQNQHFIKNTEQKKLYADALKPPPKIPIYILYAVFRV